MAPSPATDAAHLMRVTKNSSQDVGSFISALLTSIAISIGCAIAFHYLRHRFPQLYQRHTTEVQQRADSEGASSAPQKPPQEPMTGVASPEATSSKGSKSGGSAGPVTKRRDKRPFTKPGTGCCDWFIASWRLSVDDVIEHAGLDYGLLVEFTRFSLTAMLIVGLPALAILAPLHSQAGDLAQDELSVISLSNAGFGDQLGIMWVHTVYIWYVVISLLLLLKRAQHTKFYARRRAWLENMPESRARTIMVEGIPEKVRTEAEVAEFFDNIFAHTVVTGVAFVRDTSKLLALIAARNEIAETVSSLTSSGSRHRLKAAEEEYRTAAEAVKERRRLICSVSRYAYDVAFVTLRDRRCAEFARSLYYSDVPRAWKVSLPPEPSDIDFSSFSVEAASIRKGHALMGRFLVGSVFVSFLPLVLTIAALFSFSSFSYTFPALKTMENHSYISAMWDGLSGTAALTLVMDCVPSILHEIFKRFYRIRSGSMLQHRMQRWYFLFLLVYVLLVTAVGSSLIQTAASIAESPLELWRLLAATLPDTTNFYLSYAVLQWSTPFFDLLRLWPLFCYVQAVRNGIGADKARADVEPEDQAFYGIGARSARWTLQLVIGITLCSLQPMITLLMAVNFGVRRFVICYQVVYAETRKADTGGVFWRQQMQHIQLGLMIYILLMAFVLLNRGNSSTPGIIAGCSGFAVALFNFWFPELLRLKPLPVTHAKLEPFEEGPQPTKLGRQQTAGASPVSSRAHKRVLRDYMQPELRDDEEEEEEEVDFGLKLCEVDFEGEDETQEQPGKAKKTTKNKSASCLSCSPFLGRL
ncbi:unnamed protein product [Polarella glacialis]|uniref:CSC1/OSCA1-like 7TM region domain-containing protein n=1 Tax=Polarella glacialis TaxID=89957 RepID=A0A813GNL1_POLGL|nr:unnamed protein product [Polarella glacialis]